MMPQLDRRRIPMCISDWILLQKRFGDTLKAHGIITYPNEKLNREHSIKGLIEAGKESGSGIHERMEKKKDKV